MPPLRAMIDVIRRGLIDPLVAGLRDVYNAIFVPPDAAIVAANIRAIQAIYFAAMMEELKLFAVADKLVELSQQGMLPIGGGSAGDRLNAYWQAAPTRMTASERRNIYARALGLPGGEDSTTANHEFNELWARFVSAMTTASDPVQAQAAHALAVNLSKHGATIAPAVVSKLFSETEGASALLADNEIGSAFGARDKWQLIDQVATLYLGGARNSVRYRTLASTGSTIITWLANNAEKVTAQSPDLIDDDLVSACEAWIVAQASSSADS